MEKLAPSGVADHIASAVPLGRLGEVEDVAAAALFLVSDSASYINGATLTVDGGQWLAGSLTMGGVR
jgi:NAD(P)-dependent dehydrogenase (short-subunit alcohol dehydrogenase family)